MLRVGCRPILRKYMKCKLEIDESNFSKCSELQKDMNECYDTLYMYYFNTKKEEARNKF